MKVTRVRGDTYADQFFIRSKVTGDAANLAGCTFKLSLSTTATPNAQSTPVYQLIGVVPDPLLGIVEFAPTAEQADQVGNFFFDVQMTDAAGLIRTLVLDSYVYTQDITKA